jgi:hypothetical protein
MDPKQLQQDVNDVLALAERLITLPDEDLESVTWDDDEKEEYANTFAQFQRIKALLLAAPDMLAVLAALLNSCELNTDDIGERTLRLCWRGYRVLHAATGLHADLGQMRHLEYNPATDPDICQGCAEMRVPASDECPYCGHALNTTQAVQA